MNFGWWYGYTVIRDVYHAHLYLHRKALIVDLALEMQTFRGNRAT